MKSLTISLIRLYQTYLSPDHSAWGKLRFPNGYCRYHPSCSEYCRQSIEKKGLIKGLFNSIYRLFRCNPFSGGGFDPVK